MITTNNTNYDFLKTQLVQNNNVILIQISLLSRSSEGPSSQTAAGHIDITAIAQNTTM